MIVLSMIDGLPPVVRWFWPRAFHHPFRPFLPCSLVSRWMEQTGAGSGQLLCPPLPLFFFPSFALVIGSYSACCLSCAMG